MIRGTRTPSDNAVLFWWLSVLVIILLLLWLTRSASEESRGAGLPPVIRTNR